MSCFSTIVAIASVISILLKYIIAIQETITSTYSVLVYVAKLSKLANVLIKK